MVRICGLHGNGDKSGNMSYLCVNWTPAAPIESEALSVCFIQDGYCGYPFASLVKLRNA